MSILARPIGDNPIGCALAHMYKAVVQARNKLYDWRILKSRRPDGRVISIGGIHAGGSGKTPMALLAARMLTDYGATVALLSRGYKRKSKKPLTLSPRQQASWEIAGDEPAMLRRALPNIWLGIDAHRYRCARAICRRIGAHTIFLLDDGFQHRSITRDCDIVCLPPNPFGELMLPAGYLREPIKNVRRADVLCVTGSRDQTESIKDAIRILGEQYPEKPAFGLIQRPLCWVNLATGVEKKRLACKTPVLVSGIANPERFVRTVEEYGIYPEKKIFFPDHHPFSEKEISAFFVQNQDVMLTTEKDAVRLNSLKLVNCPRIWYLKVRLGFLEADDEAEFAAILLEKQVG
jgi:tetraacyldisaccharide 4'-kinase